MQKPVAIIGFGGHGHVCAAALLAAGREVVAATELNPKGTADSNWPFAVVTDEQLQQTYSPERIDLVLGVGTIWPTNEHSSLRKIVQTFERRGYRFIGFRHPAAWVSHGTDISATAQIHAGAIIQPGARIGDFSIVNTKASIDHDCIIGRFSHIGPGATLSGNVIVGEGTHIGSGSTVIQGIRIGNSGFVAAGATVVRNVDECNAVRGVPAKSFELRNPNH